MLSDQVKTCHIPKHARLSLGQNSITKDVAVDQLPHGLGQHQRLCPNWLLPKRSRVLRTLLKPGNAELIAAMLCN
jgi:hypothetical protein